MPSSYDQLHDQYWQTSTPKAGTRYERLVAFVFKALNTSRQVVHDIKLIGASDVKHQIDVTINEGQSQKRILVECKDFDVSSDKVGLSIIRDFASVVDDIRPDEAIVITCVGFTADAQKFAKHKGIKLAVLREFQSIDWEGRIRKICVTMHIMHITEPKITLKLTDQANMDKLQHDMAKAGMSGLGISKGQPIYLNLADERIQINEFVERKSNEHPRNTPGPVVLTIPLTGSTIEVESSGGIPIDAMMLQFDVAHADQYVEVASNKIARLLLEGFEGKDIILFEEDLKRLSINDETGEVNV
ncbi:restriction endonuclease [Acidithiobacillus thiooxidans]|uniref:restriction endonuclease n=1 Tax=Acidithiobacillus thiooxidans TaxID=930 RepID=UPI001C077132|nr:restriction endonuclease [Acidithiobacillus thiooxidans]MBU2752156.1 restriction endonuclease [Acidithiobacillus thiooxidans]